ncbi:thioesterase [Mycolicibacterium anyangense]|uniref:Thioesterase n=1 Tax=Mycolicibacterium anyangense TaxID=1431246 RepID=A0A6N4WFH3_9MYCO|nr:acyl-CoA thioesterase [Mycolicibacterium anyangense]BBZ78927.1 thioesterase [Mycolicibacterium anyangense]
MTEWTTTAARPDPARLRLDSYPVIDTVQVRYADLDTNGHANNLALESMHENARALMNRLLFPDAYNVTTREFRLVNSQNAVHFLAEVHWPALVTTGAGVGRIGRTSFVQSTALFVNDACVGVADTVLVLLGDDGPVPFTDDDRAKLATLSLGSPRLT